MHLWHCDSCHHEWEGGGDRSTCDWCNSSGHIIQEYTPMASFGKFLKQYLRLYKSF